MEITENVKETFIYEYRLDKELSDNPKLVYTMIKVNCLPKTYRRVGRPTWHSHTRVWFKTDEGIWVNGAVYLTERDDARALKAFIERATINRNNTAKILANAERRLANICKITEAVEDEDS